MVQDLKIINMIINEVMRILMVSFQQGHLYVFTTLCLAVNKFKNSLVISRLSQAPELWYETTHIIIYSLTSSLRTHAQWDIEKSVEVLWWRCRSMQITYSHACWLSSLGSMGSPSKTMQHVMWLQMCESGWKGMTKTSKYYPCLVLLSICGPTSIVVLYGFSLMHTPVAVGCTGSAWLQIPVMTYHDLTESLPARLAVVGAAHGGYAL